MLPATLRENDGQENAGRLDGLGGGGGLTAVLLFGKNFRQGSQLIAHEWFRQSPGFRNFASNRSYGFGRIVEKACELPSSSSAIALSVPGDVAFEFLQEDKQGIVAKPRCKKRELCGVDFTNGNGMDALGHFGFHGLKTGMQEYGFK